MSLAAAPTGSNQRIRQYRDIELNSRIEAATPHALVAMLYESLSAELGVLARALALGDTGLQAVRHERANTLLLALEGGLDQANGGALATSLASIYRQMRRRLLAARNGDALALRELIDGVASLNDAWQRIAP